MWPFLILSILIVIIDRIFKSVIFKKFLIGSSYPIIRGILHISPTYNKGVAFGLFKKGPSFILIALSIIVSFFILYVILTKRPKAPLLTSGLFLILAGALGNLFDRLAYGYVLDFIDIRIWPVFNIADCSITTGSCLILWYLFRARGMKK